MIDGMKAITFAGFRDVEYTTVEDPRIEQPGDVIVRVAAAGICGSDLHPYHEREEGLDWETVMGHEFVGEVVEVGAEVAKIKVGDHVYCPFSTNCGDCHYCRIGLTSRCVRGQLFGWVGMGEGEWGMEPRYFLCGVSGRSVPYLVRLGAKRVSWGDRDVELWRGGTQTVLGFGRAVLYLFWMNWCILLSLSLGSVGGFTASGIAANGLVYFCSERGDVFVVKAGPEYQLVAHNSINDILMATPAISEDAIYFRAQKSVIL